MIIEWRPANDPLVSALVAAQQAELAGMAPDPEQVAFRLHDDVDFALGLIDGEPVACGGLQRLDDRETGPCRCRSDYHLGGVSSRSSAICSRLAVSSPITRSTT